MKKNNIFPLKLYHNYEFEFLKEIHINSLNRNHDIHALIFAQDYLFYKHFHIDIDQSIANGSDPPSVEQLLAESRALEKEIIKLSN